MESKSQNKAVFKAILPYLVYSIVIILLALVAIPAFLGSRQKAKMGAFEAKMRAASRNISDNGLFIDTAEAVQAQDNRKLIKTGGLNLRVENIRTAIGNVTSIASRFGGLVFSSNVSSWSGHEEAEVELKVPAAAFDDAMAALKAMAVEVSSELVKVEDITERYIDTEARLVNMKAQEESFLRLMKRAEKVEDIVSITRELGIVRGDIESLQGKLNYMKSQVLLSTINVSLQTEAVLEVEGWQIGKAFKSAYDRLVRGLKYFVRFIIDTVFIVPVVLLYAGAAVFFYMAARWLWRKFSANRGEQPPAG